MKKSTPPKKVVVDRDRDGMKGGGSCKMAQGGTVRGTGAAIRGTKFKDA